MARTPTWTLIVASLGLALPAGLRAAPGEAPAQVLASMGWLEGRWSGRTSDGEDFEATYSSPAGGVILGISKALAGGRAVFTEFERFEVTGGEVVVTPFPDGRRARAFALTAHDPAARRAVFEDPANDFPRRLVYERVADDRLRIEVAGDQGGRAVTLVLELRRL